MFITSEIEATKRFRAVVTSLRNQFPRKRFRAVVTSLRNQFPRIVVKYTATEDGETAAIALPEMRSAYLCAADVQPRDW